MDFNIDKDFSIFDELLQKRSEINALNLKKDLQLYYLPFIEKLVKVKKNNSPSKGLIVGVSAIQGAGKTTQGEVLEVLLKKFGYSSVSRSIDDHYVTHRELCEIRRKDPRFIRRGVTHDISLAILDLRDLRDMENEPILVSGYDKGANKGDGDRFKWVNLDEGISLTVKLNEVDLTVNKELKKVLAIQLISVTYKENEVYQPKNMGSDIPVVEHLLPKELIDFLNSQNTNQELTVSLENDSLVKFKGSGEVLVPKKTLPNGWRIIPQKPDFIFYDGWMLGARKVEDESVFNLNFPALETNESKEFAKMVNKKLENYEPLWEMFGFMNVLYVINYQNSLKWRDQAEDILRASGEGMTHEQIAEFVHYFWRSVHPGIHIKALAKDTIHTNQVVIINDDHSVGEILSPVEVAKKYP